MTEHLPECPVEKMLRSGRTVGSQSCICEQLRACEQRCDEKRQAEVRAWSELSRDNFDDGYAAGLDAAREAVENMRDALHTHYRIGCEPPGKVDWSQHRKCDPVDDILAAIDALREEKK